MSQNSLFTYNKNNIYDYNKDKNSLFNRIFTLDIQEIETFFSVNTLFYTSIDISDSDLFFVLKQDDFHIEIKLDLRKCNTGEYTSNRKITCLNPIYIKQIFFHYKSNKELYTKYIFRGSILNLKHLKNVLLAVFETEDAKNFFNLTTGDL